MLAAQYFKLADFGLASFMGPQGLEVTSIVSVRILLIRIGDDTQYRGRTTHFFFYEFRNTSY